VILLSLFPIKTWITAEEACDQLTRETLHHAAPAELEDLLLGHPKVEDTAVLGVADEYSGEVPKAYVVPKGGAKAGTPALGRELMRYVRERKVRYKAVREVEFIDAIPKSASGKILRRVLRDKSRSGEHGMVVREERASL